MANARCFTGASLIAITIAAGTIAASLSGTAARAADALLSGTVTSAAGERMGGVAAKND